MKDLFGQSAGEQTSKTSLALSPRVHDSSDTRKTKASSAENAS
jgi:hypothetical protein